MALKFGPGVALKMYPGEMIKYGASCISDNVQPVEAENHFLCLKADATGGLWTPLHVARGVDREPIPEDSKSGAVGFVRGLSYFSTRELWQVPHKAAHKAASIAAGRHGIEQENRVSGKWLPTLAMFPAAKQDSQGSPVHGPSN